MPKKNGNAPLRLTLPPTAIKRLKNAGIRCTPEVSLEYRRAAKTYVLRGRESGGAVKAIARYVTFCGEKGEQLPWFMRPDSPSPNGDHAIVITPALVSIEMFRFEHTYELLILRHTIAETKNGNRPTVLSQVLFRGWQGQLPLDLMGRDKSLAGTIAPEFFERSGEPRHIPVEFTQAAQAVTKAANCLDCFHSHYLVAQPAAVTSPIRLSDRKQSLADGSTSTDLEGRHTAAVPGPALQEVG